MTTKDLPLHSVENEDVLEALKDFCDIQSKVLYAYVWHNGHLINICNRDQFAYVLQQDISAVPDHIEIGSYRGWIFKPKAQTECKRCHQVGHRPLDSDCPARAPPEMLDTMQPFRGGKFPLSNLHRYPHGCKLIDGSQDFLTSKHISVLEIESPQ